MTMAAAAAAVVVMLVCSGGGAATALSSELGKKGGNLGAHFVFGDSHVDAGNNNHLASLSRADFPPNGIDFEAFGGWPTGRFTNGRTIADIIGEELGQPNYAPAFLAPSTQGAAIINGVNYASGAGGILNDSGRLFANRLGMDVQVDYFSTTRDQLGRLLGEPQAKDLVGNNSIFTVLIGGNDVLNNYMLPVISMGEQIFSPPGDFVEHLVDTFRVQLRRLYELDARKFVVMGMGPLGCIPYQKSGAIVVDEEGCASLPNQLAVKYNGRLKEVLHGLQIELPGATFVYANLYGALMEVIANHEKYGFETASMECCGIGGKFSGAISCRPGAPFCFDRKGYVFWDIYHPTETTNLIIAKRFVDGKADYVSPINIRQLNAI